MLNQIPTLSLLAIGAVLFTASAIGQHSPGLAMVFLGVAIFLPFAWRLIVVAVRDFVLGFFAAEGVKASGVLRQVGRRPRTLIRPRERDGSLPQTANTQDAVSALANLGYSRSRAKSVVAAAAATLGPDAPLADLIAGALRR